MRRLSSLLLSFWASSLMAGSLCAAELERAFVVPPRTFPTNHAASIIELPQGELLTCWFAGTKEAGRDVHIVCSRLQNGAWRPPTIAVAPGERARGASMSNKFVGNPVLLRDDEGYVWLFYEAVAVGGHSGAYVDYKVSADGGRTWSRSERLAGSFGDFGHLPRNHALRLGNNHFLLPLYREFLSKYGYTVEMHLRGGKIVKQTTHRIPGTGHLQPSLVRLNARTVAAYLRNTDGKRVLVSFFDLPSRRWSRPVATNLPNPNAAVDAVTTADGRTLLVYNDSETSRSPLSVAVSGDGIRFEKLFDVETGAGSFAYPSIVRGSGGDYHLVYTYNRDTIRYLRFTVP